MAVTVGGTSITFNDGSSLTTDPMRFIALQQAGLSNGARVSAAQSAVVTPVNNSIANRYNWINYAGPISGRGSRYNALYYAYDADGYTGWAAGLQGTSRLTISNITNSPLRINLEHGIWDITDDISGWHVYEDGTITNSTTHSGGTLLYDSGWGARSGSWWSPVKSSVILTRDIPANSTKTWTLYAGVTGGSSQDAVCGILDATFNAWL